tara:strand:+ start:1492 stop:2184 length:693 start_codon:yes stop_codon:yes gene_type:complete
MLTIPTKFVIDSARKLNLVFWQITEGGHELARQDEDLSIDDSLQILDDTINELKESARSGDKVKVAMQSQPMESTGRKKGMHLRTFYIYLKEPESARNMQGISNLSLLEENIRLKMTMEHEKEKSEWIKRIEALENAEEETEGFDKVINGLNNLMASPATQLLIGLMMNGKGSPTAPAPAINGLPKQDYSDLLERIEKIDPEFNSMLNAIVIAAESEPATYFMYKKQLVK